MSNKIKLENFSLEKIKQKCIKHNIKLNNSDNIPKSKNELISELKNYYRSSSKNLQISKTNDNNKSDEITSTLNSILGNNDQYEKYIKNFVNILKKVNNNGYESLNFSEKIIYDKFHESIEQIPFYDILVNFI